MTSVEQFNCATTSYMHARDSLMSGIFSPYLKKIIPREQATQWSCNTNACSSAAGSPLDHFFFAGVILLITLWWYAEVHKNRGVTRGASSSVVCAHTYMCTHVRAYVRACMQACMPTCMHSFIRAYMQTCIHAYVHTSIHANMQTCVI